jgi:Uma2 family endonuclease
MLRVPVSTSNHLYPTAETDYHRELIFQLIVELKMRYPAASDPYVSSNLLIFYRPHDRRRHVSSDCFVVFGVPKMNRLNYLTWEEGKSPDVVIELTSKMTRREDGGDEKLTERTAGSSVAVPDRQEFVPLALT